MRNRRYLERPNTQNYLGRQIVGSNYGRGGVQILPYGTGFTTTTTTVDTDFLWTFQAVNPVAGAGITFRVGSASTIGHELTGAYYSKYNNRLSVNDGVYSAKGRNFGSFRVFVVGGGNGGGYGPSNGGGPPIPGASGGAGGSLAGPNVYTGVSTDYTIRFGTSPEPSAGLYFKNPTLTINIAGVRGAGGAGGGGSANYPPGSNPNAGNPGLGGSTSDITGSSQGYGGGGGGGRGWGNAPTSGGNGANGGGSGAPTGTPPWPGMNGTNGGGGGGAASGPGWAGRAGGSGSPYYIIIRSAPDSTNTFDQ